MEHRILASAALLVAMTIGGCGACEEDSGRDLGTNDGGVNSSSHDNGTDGQTSLPCDESSPLCYCAYLSVEACRSDSACIERMGEPLVTTEGCWGAPTVAGCTAVGAVCANNLEYGQDSAGLCWRFSNSCVPRSGYEYSDKISIDCARQASDVCPSP